MDNLFFIVSKIGWSLVSPQAWLLILGVGCWLCLLSGWQATARKMAAALALLLVLFSAIPLGELLIAPLENRFPANAALPRRADGVIVLGGAMDSISSNAWNQVQLNDNAERMTAFAYLAGLYPDAQLVFSGGSGSLVNQEFKEADWARVLMEQLGLGPRAIIYEGNSRNTYENAANSYELVSPQAGEEWVLVTSAFHMPRAVGVFCQFDWPVTPYPVDHKSRRGQTLRLNFALNGNMRSLEYALREWLGLAVYRVTGRSGRFLPSSEQQCSGNQETDSAQAQATGA